MEHSIQQWNGRVAWFGCQNAQEGWVWAREGAMAMAAGAGEGSLGPTPLSASTGNGMDGSGRKRYGGVRRPSSVTVLPSADWFPPRKSPSGVKG